MRETNIRSGGVQFANVAVVGFFALLQAKECLDTNRPLPAIEGMLLSLDQSPVGRGLRGVPLHGNIWPRGPAKRGERPEASRNGV